MAAPDDVRIYDGTTWYSLKGPPGEGGSGGSASELRDSLRTLAIFYAAPGIVNLVYDNDYAAGTLARFDDIVLGAGLADPAEPNYANSIAVISKLKALKPDIRIWGYVDIGVLQPPTNNYTVAQMKTQIDQWVTAGATDIFGDDWGYDFHVSRARQNEFLDYVHTRGAGTMGVMMNAWTVDDACGSLVEATYNPTGIAPHIDERDVYLLESWIINTQAFAAPYYATFWDLKVRADAARVYRASTGVKLYACSMAEHTALAAPTLAEYRGMGEALAKVFRLDGYGLTCLNYSSTGADIGLLFPYFPLVRNAPARPTAPYILNGPWTEISAPDLGLVVHYEASDHHWNQA